MTFHSLCTGFAQFVLPLPVCHCIACSGTIYIFIIDYFMNGTKINHKQLVGIIVGIAGVIIVSNGKLLTKFLDP
jgi:multidrug transporter EmrE-like cation transporter